MPCIVRVRRKSYTLRRLANDNLTLWYSLDDAYCLLNVETERSCGFERVVRVWVPGR